MPDQYLIIVKDRLNITFGHKDDDVIRMISEGMASIRSWVGAITFALNPEHDDIVGILANELLLDLVRYKWNGSGQYFQQEHRSNILTLQLEVAKRNAKT